MKSKKMTIKSILKIIGFAIFVISFMTFNVFYSKTKELEEKKNIENFTGEMSYNDCIGKGYSKEFCVQTPTSVVGPGGCRCPNGSLGRKLPGFRGQCVCDEDYNDSDYMNNTNNYNSDLI